jgi:hypothetical protein
MWRKYMSRISILASLMALLVPFSHAQTIAGIHLGDSASALEKLGAKPAVRETHGSMETVKYELANGNDLSSTYDRVANRIVYLECDWNRGPKSVNTDFAGFKFGVTTLADIRISTGSNGFSYKSNAMNASQGEMFTFNAYRIKDGPGLVVVFVTAFNIKEVRTKSGNRNPTDEEIPKNLKLDALILAEESYLDTIWGAEKVSDKENKPIAWIESKIKAAGDKSDKLPAREN